LPPPRIGLALVTFFLPLFASRCSCCLVLARIERPEAALRTSESLSVSQISLTWCSTKDEKSGFEV